MRIFARARNLEEPTALLAEGVKESMPETVESSLMMGYGLLTSIGISDMRIKRLLGDLRDNHYAALRAADKK
jgi:hypothetical protein